MNFEMSDDRRMLSDTLRRTLAQAGDIARRNRIAYAAPFHDPAVWDGLAGLGLFHALVREERGGLGGGGFDVAVIFEELGRALCPEPVLGQVLAASLLDAAGADLAPLLEGTRHALALSETEAPYDPAEIATEARETDDGWRITGRKTVVYGAPCAQVLLVAARAGDCIALFEVAPADAAIAGYAMIDGGPAGEVLLEAAPARLLLADAGTALARALDLGALALCAEALGAMEVTQATLRDYLRTRTQFGQPIGSFQALQHRAVDLAIEIEQARSIVILAADAADTAAHPAGGPAAGAAFARRASQAKHLVGRIARQVAEEAIQMHGGIGLTWDYPLSHYAKRLVMIDHQLGDTDWHLERLMAALLED